MTIKLNLPKVRKSDELVVPKFTKDISPQTNYGISVMNTSVFWNEGYEGQGVIIAVIDSGCDEHEQLNANIIDGFNLTTDDDGQIDVITDHFGHGTHVSGIIAATNEKHLIGIAPKAKLLIIKVINKFGSSNFETLIKGIEFARNWRGANGEKIDIINMSLGSTKDNEDLRKEVELSFAQNIAIVTAAGNEGDGTDTTIERSYPGYYEEVFQIGSIDQDYKITNFSNSNNNIDYVSPGESIFSTYQNNTYESLSGTSMSAPQISGIIALLLSYYKENQIEYDQDMIRDFLDKNAVKLVGYSSSMQGKGVIALHKEEEGKKLMVLEKVGFNV